MRPHDVDCLDLHGRVLSHGDRSPIRHYRFCGVASDGHCGVQCSRGCAVVDRASCEWSIVVGWCDRCVSYLISGHAYVERCWEEHKTIMPSLPGSSASLERAALERVSSARSSGGGGALLSAKISRLLVAQQPTAVQPTSTAAASQPPSYPVMATTALPPAPPGVAECPTLNLPLTVLQPTPPGVAVRPRTGVPVPLLHPAGVGGVVPPTGADTAAASSSAASTEEEQQKKKKKRGGQRKHG